MAVRSLKSGQLYRDGITSLKNKSKANNLTAPGDVDLGAMIPIATVSLSSDSTYINFTDIPQNYSHLQFRTFGRSTRTYSGNNIDAPHGQFNGGYFGNTHLLNGDGGGSSGVTATQGNYVFGLVVDDYAPANMFSSSIIDVFDYSNTNKYKTVRTFYGLDVNSRTYPYSGHVGLNSAVWQSTAAITSVSFYMQYGGIWKAGSTVALYGIKRAGA